uniref:Uncharacterized protein n=1 Tax=Magallana gigas TaxID=29159 RepID=K1PTM6_MAGGI
MDDDYIHTVGMPVTQCGVKHVYVQLYKHIHCRLGDGLNTASDSAIDRLPESLFGFVLALQQIVLE